MADRARERNEFESAIWDGGMEDELGDLRGGNVRDWDRDRKLWRV